MWSFWPYFGYMVNGQSDFCNTFFGYIVISAIRMCRLSRTKPWPFTRNPVYHEKIDNFSKPGASDICLIGSVTYR